ncbi:Hypothetical Protein FCC1311_054562 [Hondaea fermentalgiana]|uniref:Uncharacterized protein n=1 Tax=Hondaea fermentalgiana TaxID=2315210 RepID=A0A2R5GMZ1_9STRA|nr:Hypothetical Protein FCC1311_054562 [Hondaea fermentalgiana]|eukprot:GBG29234.1 Hypothetical Protein FCC1311_054562 [Hondaea fermentalgiana]
MAARFIRYGLDREPMVVVSVAIGAFSLGMVAVVPKVRLAMGLPTDQYFGMEDPATGRYRDTLPRSRQYRFVKDLGVKPELLEEE